MSTAGSPGAGSLRPFRLTNLQRESCRCGAKPAPERPHTRPGEDSLRGAPPGTPSPPASARNGTSRSRTASASISPERQVDKIGGSGRALSRWSATLRGCSACGGRTQRARGHVSSPGPPTSGLPPPANPRSAPRRAWCAVLDIAAPAQAIECFFDREQLGGRNIRERPPVEATLTSSPAVMTSSGASKSTKPSASPNAYQ